MSTLLTAYTEYLVAAPEWFAQTIEEAVNQRDVAGLLGGNRAQGIKVSTSHPLVQITGQVLASNSKPNMAGVLPAVSVMLTAENGNEVRVLGRGRERVDYRINLEVLDTIRNTHPKMLTRVREGLLTDDQMAIIEREIRSIATAANLLPEQVSLRCEVEGFWIRESISVSLWAATQPELLTLQRLMRSVIYGLQTTMVKRHLRDLSITTDPGLVNFNFGQILFGAETEISYLNHFVTVNVFKEQALDPVTKLVIYMDLGVTGLPDEVTTDNGTIESSVNSFGVDTNGP